MKSLHDQTMPELELWQQNFLLLNGLAICTVSATIIGASASDGRQWMFKKSGTLQAWRAQYIGRTHPPERKIQRYDPNDWIKL